MIYAHVVRERNIRIVAEKMRKALFYKSFTKTRQI